MSTSVTPNFIDTTFDQNSSSISHSKRLNDISISNQTFKARAQSRQVRGARKVGFMTNRASKDFQADEYRATDSKFRCEKRRNISQQVHKRQKGARYKTNDNFINLKSKLK